MSDDDARTLRRKKGLRSASTGDFFILAMGLKQNQNIIVVDSWGEKGEGDWGVQGKVQVQSKNRIKSRIWLDDCCCCCGQGRRKGVGGGAVSSVWTGDRPTSVETSQDVTHSNHQTQQQTTKNQTTS